jgi:predicted nucleotidyltransferase
MTWRVPPFDRAALAAEAHVRATYAPRGIVIAGSIVRGEAGPSSDLDIVVIHDAPWRLREQLWFEGVPAEVFVNPPAQIREYFASEHAEGRPCTAHMLATGEPLAPIDPIVSQLVDEAKAWLVRPLEPTAAQLESMRYAAVDSLDDARDVAQDPAAAQLLLADTVKHIIAYAFWRARRFQPRRKATLMALAEIDPEAAELVRRWAVSGQALQTVEELAHHVLGVDTFFAWSSGRDPRVS